MNLAVILSDRKKIAIIGRKRWDGTNSNPSLFLSLDATGEILKSNCVTDYFKIVLKGNGLKHIRFHNLRHSRASLLLANGVPMKMIRDWLGHSNMGTTVNIHSHIDSESKKVSAMASGTALG